MPVLLPANGEILIMNYGLQFVRTLENESQYVVFLAFQKPLYAPGSVQLFVHNLNIVMHTVYTKIALKIGLLSQNCTCVNEIDPIVYTQVSTSRSLTVKFATTNQLTEVDNRQK